MRPLIKEAGRGAKGGFYNKAHARSKCRIERIGEEEDRGERAERVAERREVWVLYIGLNGGVAERRMRALSRERQN